MSRWPWLALIAACGSDPGEPIGGSLGIEFDGELVIPTVGATVLDSATTARVILGTRDINCQTTDDDPLERGTYLVFTIDVEPTAQTPFVSVIRVVPGGTHLNGGPGDVTIDAIDDRVTGSVTLATTDDAIGLITADGTFDVARCF